MKRISKLRLIALTFGLTLFSSAAQAQQKKPNILVLWGDDIGWWNISAYNHGQMGYKTPNIDSIIKQGVMSTCRHSRAEVNDRAGLDVWQNPFIPLRLPKLFNLHSDPFEIADHENVSYGKWRVDRAFLLVPAQSESRQLLARQCIGTADEQLQLIAFRPRVQRRKIQPY